ncbi:hypothetical protein BO71DRAFT_436344 [Aspergillus ellipticus CBS 707.79]|uniref:Uncharacterized protein n=1 Tax=Aspergillus ellipticus CBS 707.79 TaxID=1448320 RepID=A0A319DIA3_9EURO|nr:hypothetical protein BO71DRAFT_436344 [Aspergillus ellipticus CBS 707.79]
MAFNLPEDANSWSRKATAAQVLGKSLKSGTKLHPGSSTSEAQFLLYRTLYPTVSSPAQLLRHWPALAAQMPAMHSHLQNSPEFLAFQNALRSHNFQPSPALGRFSSLIEDLEIFTSRLTRLRKPKEVLINHMLMSVYAQLQPWTVRVNGGGMRMEFR